MFSANSYQLRRNGLKANVSDGIIVLPANMLVGINYSANTYPFRQDSTFLYYCGLNRPGLVLVLDCNSGEEWLLGNEHTMDDIVWEGPADSLSDLCKMSGIEKSISREEYASFLKKIRAENRKIHFLPQYQGQSMIELGEILSLKPGELNQQASEALIMAIISQRVTKSPEEIMEIEKAVKLTGELHLSAMRSVKEGISEADVYGNFLKIVGKNNSSFSFSPIISKDGEILHNHSHGNQLKNGDLLLVDCGAESPMGYAGDMTRTIPVSGTYSEKQKEVYQIVLDSQMAAITAVKPEVPYVDIHMIAAKVITEGLQKLGLMKGNVDESLKAGAHALFFPHGLGHMMGLDVHDMEGLGENFVGYGEGYVRSEQFGTAFLRLARPLKEGNVITIEPGIYFIPPLIEKWKSQRINADFLNFSKIEEYLDFGGIRIEDDYLVTKTGGRLLGNSIPKKISDVEAEMNLGNRK